MPTHESPSKMGFHWMRSHKDPKRLFSNKSEHLGGRHMLSGRKPAETGKLRMPSAWRAQVLNAFTGGHPAALVGGKKNEPRASRQPLDAKHGGVNAVPDPSRAHVSSRVALCKRAAPAHAAEEVAEASATLATSRQLTPSPTAFQLRMHPSCNFSALRRLATPAARPVGMNA